MQKDTENKARVGESGFTSTDKPLRTFPQEFVDSATHARLVPPKVVSITTQPQLTSK